MSHEPRRADRLRRGQVAEPDRAVLESRGDQTAIAAKRRTDGRRRGGQEPGENFSGRGIAELDRAVLTQCEEGTTVGTESSGASSIIGSPSACPRVVSHSASRAIAATRKQGSTIRPEFDSGDILRAGQ